MDDNWYDSYVNALEQDKTFYRLAHSANDAASDLIDRNYDSYSPTFLSILSGILLGMLSGIVDTKGAYTWLWALITAIISIGALCWAVRANLQNKKRLHKKIAFLYYAYYLQYQVIDDSAHGIHSLDSKYCKQAKEYILKDRRSNWPAEDVIEEYQEFYEKVFRV